MNITHPNNTDDFENRQRKYVSENLRKYVKELGDLLERMREDCDIIDADPEIFGDERPCYRAMRISLNRTRDALSMMSLQLAIPK